jgi:NhaA family Na+:H+ antiporter
MATDIAFSLGLLSLLGRRVPLSVKVFLTALAIIDDLGAIAVIAVFYGHGFHLEFFLYAFVVFCMLWGLNRLGVYQTLPYLLLGIVLWGFVYKSGIHATVAGILLAITIPTRPPPNLRGLLAQARAIFHESADEAKALNNQASAYPDDAILHAFDAVYDRLESPAHRIERKLEPWMSFLILPIFALTNAGVTLFDVEFDQMVSLGVVVGLVIGKPLGIVGGCFLLLKLLGGNLPNGMNWPILVGVGCLAGVGFTMSIFISNQAFTDPSLLSSAKLAVLSGSLISALIGLGLLTKYLPQVGQVSRA